MSYRDERDALQARIEDLETELARARHTIARLEGRAQDPRSLGARLLGAPTRLMAEAVIPRALTPEDHEAVVGALRAHYRQTGRSEVVGRTFAWSTGSPQQGTTLDFILAPGPGGTTVNATERLGGIAGGLFGGVVGGAGGGGLGFVLPIALLRGSGALAVVAAIAWVALVYAIVRAGYRALAERRARVLRAAAASVVAALDARSATAPERIRAEAGTQIRVESVHATDASQTALEADASAPAHAEPASEEARMAGSKAS